MKKKVLLITGVTVLCVLTGIMAAMKMWNKSPVEEEPVTLKWYINYSWFTTEWGQNIVSQKISEATGVNVEFIVPKGEEGVKLDSMINSDSLPDLVTLGWWEPQNYEMIETDMVYALNELDEQYDMGFMDVANQDSVAWYTQPDGNIYGYPNYSYTYKDFLNDKVPSHQNFLVRKDIYEAIGSPDMSTPEGFSNAVRKAVQMFPQVDGKPLIPIGADEFTDNGCNSFDLYLQNFLAVPFEADGQYYDRNTDEEYLRWLKVFRELGEEGYLKNEIFIDKRSQQEERILSGQYFCLFYQSTDIKNQQKQIASIDPERIYIAVDGPKNSSGDDPVLPVQGICGWTQTYISKNCSIPDKALQLMTYLLSEEGKKMVYLGEEGTMYTTSGDTQIIHPEILSLLNTDRPAYDALYGADDTYWMLQDVVNPLKWVNTEPECMRQLKEWTLPYVAYTGQYDLDFGEDTAAAKLYINMKHLWGDTLPKLLLAKSEAEFDAVLQDYIVKRNQAGYADFQSIATEKIRMNKEKLGIDQ